MSYLTSFIIAFSAIVLFFATNGVAAAANKFLPTPTIYKAVLQENDSISFFPLAPCPSCNTPSQPPVGNGSNVPGTVNTSPATFPNTNTNPNTVDPCVRAEKTSVAGERHKKKKHKKKNSGAVGKGTESILQVLVELLNALLKLLGGGQIPTPNLTNPTDSDPCPTDNEEDTDENNDEENNDEDANNEEDNEDEQNTDPVDTMPQASTAPVNTAPSITAPSGAPGGATSACTAPAGMTALIDQDSSDSQLPWKRNGAAKVVITFQTKGVPADWVAEMQKGVAAWNKSPCLDTKLVDTCQPNTYCVPVVVGDGGGDDGNFNATEQGGFTVKGDIQLLSTLTGGERTNVTIHEMGHAVGLAHRTQRVLMNTETFADIFDPDETDMKNLLFIYGKQQ